MFTVVGVTVIGVAVVTGVPMVTVTGDADRVTGAPALNVTVSAPGVIVPAQPAGCVIVKVTPEVELDEVNVWERGLTCRPTPAPPVTHVTFEVMPDASAVPSLTVTVIGVVPEDVLQIYGDGIVAAGVTVIV